MFIPKSILISMGAVIGTGLMITACREDEHFTYSVPRIPRSSVRISPAAFPAPIRPAASKPLALKPLDAQSPPDLIVFDPNAPRFHTEYDCRFCGMG